jgi:hypothetical protein
MNACTVQSCPRRWLNKRVERAMDDKMGEDSDGDNAAEALHARYGGVGGGDDD